MLRTLTLWLLLVVPAASFAVPRYYFVMFGTQAGGHVDFRLLRLPAFLDAASRSHSFGTFVAVENDRIVDELTISWMPAPGYFDNGFTMPKRGAVPGRNYTLDETLALVHGRGFRQWGPYEISPELYARADRRVKFLNGAPVGYRMVGTRGRDVRVPSDYNQPGGAINCIMAFHGVGGFADTGKDFGWRASRQILGTMAATGGTQVYGFPSRIQSDIARLMRLDERQRYFGIYATQGY